MSHDGDEHRGPSETPPGVPAVLTFSAATAGEVLAERYRLEEHVDTDVAGRQIWRGIDVVLRRPVALTIRQPGGEAAAAMLTTAVALSRLVHPHIVSVYDAIDEGHRAYLVREWVPGVALRELLRDAPLDAERATLVTHAIAEAVSALHAAGIVHGNIHPGTILIADDGRVVLADAHADNLADANTDIRAIGGVLYACLTGHWPRAEAGRSTLPDAARDNLGRLATPRQMRGGIPPYLDEIAAELLDLRIAPPPAPAVAAEFARLANQESEPDYDDRGPMGFGTVEATATGRRRAGGKIALGIAFLTAIAITGAFIGAQVLGASPDNTPKMSGTDSVPTVAATAGAGVPILLTPEQVRVVDPPKGDRAELRDSELAVDGNPNTGWSTDEYNAPYFGGSRLGGGLKPGMGLLINLGAPTKVGAVKVVVSQTGASLALRTGTTAPPSDSAGDADIAKNYTAVGTPLDDHSGTVMVFPVGEDQQELQYLLIWITRLPVDSDGKYVLAVNEITVLAP